MGKSRRRISQTKPRAQRALPENRVRASDYLRRQYSISHRLHTGGVGRPSPKQSRQRSFFGVSHGSHGSHSQVRSKSSRKFGVFGFKQAHRTAAVKVFQRPTWSLPSNLRQVCFARKARRAVLFALRKTGLGGQAPKKLTNNSKIRCK